MIELYKFCWLADCEINLMKSEVWSENKQIWREIEVEIFWIEVPTSYLLVSTNTNFKMFASFIISPKA